MVDHRRSPRRFAATARPRLVLGGLAAAAGVSLTGCDGPTYQQAEFTTVAQCTSAGYEQSLCDTGFKAAQAEHDKTAPRFASLKECNQEWGDGTCQPLAAAPGTPAAGGSSIGSVFVPVLAGFVLSQALQQRYDRGDVNYYGGYGGYGSPIYRSRTGNTVVLDRSGGITKATPVNVNTRTVASKGFGGMGMSRSSSRGGGFGG
ncbi:MAG: DUF1190 domain-containing protein [Novosphingobium sp.]